MIVGKYLKIFAKLPGGESTNPYELIFLFYFSAILFEFDFNPRCKIGRSPGHLDRM